VPKVTKMPKVPKVELDEELVCPKVRSPALLGDKAISLLLHFRHFSSL
jgi:hypothetical protein